MDADIAAPEVIEPEYRAWLNRRKKQGEIWHWILICATWLGVVILAVLLLQTIYQSSSWVIIEERPRLKTTETVVVKSLPLLDGYLRRDEIARQMKASQKMILKMWLSPDFLTKPPSRLALNAGINSALFGTIWLSLLVTLFTLPLGVGAAIYLEEFASKNWFTDLIQMNIQNLAGVPSIVYGILGLAAFVRMMEAITNGRSLLSGALTMTLLVLPTIIISSREAIRAVPSAIREAAYGLGATRWQTVRHQILPASLPGILTGSILSLSRAIGETAPLIMIGALTYVKEPPRSIIDAFTVLPIQIYNWTIVPQNEFKALAAAAIVVLLIVLLTLNGLAIYFRNRFSIHW